MKRESVSLLVGALLVVAGLLFLASNFGLLAGFGDILIAMLFAAGGAVFLWVFLTNTTDNWWALFPGFALLGLGGVIGVNTIFPALGAIVAGSMFLGALSLAFWVVYLVHPDFWWAIIPAGALLTLSVVAAVGNTFAAPIAGSLFFFGLALTFALLYFLPTQAGRLTWAVFPAGALGVLGVLTLLSVTQLFNWIWPVALILGGAYLLYRNSVKREI